MIVHKHIVYKYEVGDTVLFKHKFANPTCDLAGREGTFVKIIGLAKAYNNKPHYYIEGDNAAYHEDLFVGRYEP
jgi:hypothetical protein